MNNSNNNNNSSDGKGSPTSSRPLRRRIVATPKTSPTSTHEGEFPVSSPPYDHPLHHTSSVVSHPADTATEAGRRMTTMPRSVSAPELSALPGAYHSFNYHPVHLSPPTGNNERDSRLFLDTSHENESSQEHRDHHHDDSNESGNLQREHPPTGGQHLSNNPLHTFELEGNLLRRMVSHRRSSSHGEGGRRRSSSGGDYGRRRSSSTGHRPETSTGSKEAVSLHSEEMVTKDGRHLQSVEERKTEHRGVGETEPTGATGSEKDERYVYSPVDGEEADFYKIFSGGTHAESDQFHPVNGTQGGSPSVSGAPSSGATNGNTTSHFQAPPPHRRPPPLRTRNINALRAFIWDQRLFLPKTRGFLAGTFTLLASPRFVEKFDWAFRAAVLCILPTLILCLEPSTQHIFPLPTSVVAYAFWITGPTLGHVLKELYLALKGFTICLTILCVFVAVQPGPTWLCLLLLFITLVILAFVAEEMRRTCAFLMSSMIMQYIRNHQSTTYKYIGDYFLTLFIALSFGLAPSFVPFVRWSSENAKHYIYVMGDSVSLSVRGVCSCFWMKGPLERQLCITRLRQLRVATEESMKKAENFISLSGYEPHTGVYIMQLKTRLQFFRGISNILQSLCTMLEQLAENPELIRTPMCERFGEEIRPALRRLSIAFDTILVRIASLDCLVTVEELERFRLEGRQFELALAQVRQRVILQNESYVTESVDVLLGYYLFSLEELVSVIGDFKENPNPRNNLIYFSMFLVRDLESTWNAIKALVRNVRHRHSITRRCKEAIKLALCIVLAAIFQVYGMQEVSSAAANALAGVDIIALVYQRTGAESFQYSIYRLLGTVLGSLTGLLSVQIAQQRRPVLYILSLILNFIGCYVMASPGWNPLGTAMANSVISVVIQYRNEGSAMLRIQQNCFAIVIYFVISSVVWPMRARTKMKLGFDLSLRFFREACHRLLSNLDTPEGEVQVAEDALQLLDGMQKRIGVQNTYLNGAVTEPTMNSSDFPEEKWKLIIRSQQRLRVNLLMMRHAYNTFMTSTVGPGISVHWVLLRRVAPLARHLSRLISAAVDIYLSGVAHTAIVPTAKLTKLRQEMIFVQRKMIQVYIEAIEREMVGYDEGQENNNNGRQDSSWYDDDDDGPRSPKRKNREEEKKDNTGKKSHQPEQKKKEDTASNKKALLFDRDEEDIFHLHSYHNNNSIFGIATPITNRRRQQQYGGGGDGVISLRDKTSSQPYPPSAEGGTGRESGARPPHLEETTEVFLGDPLNNSQMEVPKRVEGSIAVNGGTTNSGSPTGDHHHHHNHNNNNNIGYLGYKITDQEKNLLVKFLSAGGTQISSFALPSGSDTGSPFLGYAPRGPHYTNSSRSSIGPARSGSLHSTPPDSPLRRKTTQDHRDSRKQSTGSSRRGSTERPDEPSKKRSTRVERVSSYLSSSSSISSFSEGNSAEPKDRDDGSDHRKKSETKTRPPTVPSSSSDRNSYSDGEDDRYKDPSYRTKVGSPLLDFTSTLNNASFMLNPKEFISIIDKEKNEKKGKQQEKGEERKPHPAAPTDDNRNINREERMVDADAGRDNTTRASLHSGSPVEPSSTSVGSTRNDTNKNPSSPILRVGKTNLPDSGERTLTFSSSSGNDSPLPPAASNTLFSNPVINTSFSNTLKNKSFFQVINRLKNGHTPSSPEVDRKNNIVITNEDNSGPQQHHFNKTSNTTTGTGNVFPGSFQYSFNGTNIGNNGSIILNNGSLINSSFLVFNNNNNNNNIVNHNNNNTPLLNNNSVVGNLVQNNFSFFDLEKGEFVLTNRDIHSLEAFLYGVSAVVRVMDELERNVLDMMHQQEMTRKL